MIVITADDYGKSRRATDSIRHCFLRGRITSASAMVFMEDSERAASFAAQDSLEVGLHLNFTLPFNGRHVPSGIRECQNRVGRYLARCRFAQAIYNPFLADSFNSLFLSQEDEFIRLYGKRPEFYNGHHHMHLCANVLAGKVIPEGTTIRRTFTFAHGEKDYFNVLYRRLVDTWVSRHFVSTDSFFSIVPVEDHERLGFIIKRAAIETVEIEVHPENCNESELLLSDAYKDLLRMVYVGSFRHMRKA